MRAINSVRSWSLEDSSFVRNVLNDMPAFGEKILSVKDLNDVYAFLQSLPGRNNPKDIGLLTLGLLAWGDAVARRVGARDRALR